MSCCTSGELALKARFEDAYANSQSPVMRAIERQVCGCDYGGNSWTTRDQADDLVRLLNLGPGLDLIDLGAGTGWPGLYLARTAGCSVALVDLPELGLEIARQRARADGIDDLVTARISDAASLPYADQSFDAVSHSDLLCCLVRKREVLMECRRVARVGGAMAFTVIYIAPGLSGAAHARALASAPDFVETGASYPDLIADTGWRMIERQDLTDAYRDSCARQVEADMDSQTGLADLLGEEQAAKRLRQWRTKLAAIEDGFFVRELFLCRKTDEEVRP